MRSVALSVVLVVLLCLGAAGVAAGSPATDTGGLADSTAAVGALDSTASGQPVSTLSTGDSNTPSTVFTINLQSDRDAEWVVTVEYDLETESQREAFESIAADFEDGSAPAGGLSVELYENMAGFASQETDREMEITDAERSSSLDGDSGTLQLAFTWSAFLEQEEYDDGERLIFNDALNSPDDGTWLASLGEHQELRITTPSGYAITSANVPFSDNTVTIEGPHTFDREDHVRIILEPSSFAGTAWELLGAAAVVAAAIIGGAFLLRRRETDPGGEGTQPTQPTTGSETATQSTTEPTTPDTPTGPESAAEPEETAEPTEDLSLLADDERVLRLLEQNGGRMRQAEIVSETKWSDAKVSQLLSSMADDDQITKLRIGRENLISMPDVDALDGSKRDDE